MTPRDSSDGRWQSLHLFMSQPFEPFLIDQLMPFLQTEIDSGKLRRFFFIRYSEGGNHLRLRFRPRAPADESLGQWRRRLAARAERHLRHLGAASKDYRLEIVRYDRSEHYFGDTLDSVYAELLNEATSWLALHLLRSLGPERRTARWLVLVATLDLLLRRATLDAAERLTEFGSSRDFARRAARSVGFPLKDPEAAGQRWADTVASVCPRITSEADLEPRVERIVAPLRRVRHRGPRGRFVATHALHLLCNKLGFTLAEEHEAFATLEKLAEARMTDRRKEENDEPK